MGERLVLDIGVDAVRVGRRYVERQVREYGLGELAADAELVAAELLANARQHGAPPIAVRVGTDGSAIRIEVDDASGRGPVRTLPSTSNMTGRGLALVAALCDRWGVGPAPAEGKSVWCELRPHANGSQVRNRALARAGFVDETADQRPADTTYTVELGDVPTALLLEAKAHIDNLVREFSLAATSQASGVHALPEHLVELIETVTHEFDDARAEIKRQAIAAAERGDERTHLVLHLPASAADAGVAYLAALDQADEYARASRLLTLAAPADHRLFRHWYVESLINQLRSLAAGTPARPARPFESVLLEEVRRLSAAQRIGDRAARLHRVTAALARARTPEDVGNVVVSEGVAVLGAYGGALITVADDGKHLSVPGVVGYQQRIVGLIGEETVDDPLPAATAVRTGDAMWIESPHERDERFPQLTGLEADTVAMCAVPLIVADHILGALRFSFDSPKLFDRDERSFVLALAAYTAQTLLRTELYQAEREAALQLQRALLPDRVVDVPGWLVAAHYSPAGQNEAGGDFYDLIPLPDGRFVAVVGDVMGRGLEAAAAMGQVRTTIRAYAVDDPDPVRVFGRVAGYFEALDVPQLVTVLYLLIDPAEGTVDVANAGHLPPILVSEGGAEIVEVGVDLPFGVGGLDWSASRLVVAPGSELIAFTDGLVERRGEDIDLGIARVVAAVTRSTARTPAARVRELVDLVLTDDAHDDDVTALALRRLPTTTAQGAAAGH